MSTKLREVIFDSHWFTSGEIFDNGYMHGKIFNMNLIFHHHLHFEEDVKMAEDLLFVLDYLSVLPMKFSLVKASGCSYHYVRTGTGLSYAKNSSEHDLNLFNHLLSRINTISSIHNLKITPKVLEKIAPHLFQSMKSIANSNQRWDKRMKQIKALKSTYGEYIISFQPYCRLDKVLKMLLLSSPFLFIIIGGTYMKLTNKI